MLSAADQNAEGSVQRTVKGLRANPQPLDPAVHTETTCENGVCTIHVGARDTDEPLAFRISGQDDVI